MGIMENAIQLQNQATNVKNRYRAVVLICGYIRQQIANNVPLEIKDICLAFYYLFGDTIRNALVLLIGISKYSHDEYNDLPADITKYESLWRNDFKYDVRPRKEDTEWFGKTEWTKREIIEFLEEMREDLIVDKKLQYDAM